MEYKKEYELIKRFPHDIIKAYNLTKLKLTKTPERIIILGMGGCYISGMILKQLLKHELKIPIEVYPGEIPIINKKDLIILISYSGNTTEIINAYSHLKKHDLVIITSGGKLLKLVKNKPVIVIPKNLHPRFTICYTMLPILRLLENSKLIKEKKRLIHNIIGSIIAKTYELESEARKLSHIIHHKTPVFYGTYYFYPIAYRFRTSIEEDAKIVCHSGTIPEFFHNEIEAYPSILHFPILFIDKKESKDYKKRIEHFKLLSKHYYEFGFYDNTPEERIFLAIHFADYLGYYLSEIRNKTMGFTPISDKVKTL